MATDFHECCNKKSFKYFCESLATDFYECCKECCNAIISMNITMQCFATDIQEWFNEKLGHRYLWIFLMKNISMKVMMNF